MDPADDFYVEDESMDDIRAAIKRGEKDQTAGRRDLNQRARAIVDRAISTLERVPTVQIDTEDWDWTVAPAAGSSESTTTATKTAPQAVVNA